MGKPDMSHGNGGITYNIPIASQALTTGAGGWDLLTITASSSSRFELVKVDLQIVSTQATVWPGIGLQLMRGSTGVSTGAAIVPANVKGWTGAQSAGLTATAPSSTPISTASAVAIHAGAFDANGSFRYEPSDRPVMAIGQRLNLRTSTPQVPATITGCVVVRETGKALPS
jgi:hypothetical protein